MSVYTKKKYHSRQCSVPLTHLSLDVNVYKGWSLFLTKWEKEMRSHFCHICGLLPGQRKTQLALKLGLITELLSLHLYR